MTPLSLLGMRSPHRPSSFLRPPDLRTDSGDIRRVGFELEFAGLSLDDASLAVAESLGAAAMQETGAEYRVNDSKLGDFVIEVDWTFLKEQAEEASESGENPQWLIALRELAKAFVPVEVVCPPVNVDQLDALEPIVDALREAGAKGTSTSPLAAFGVHVNAETPSMDSETLHRYLRAYSLLQWWLMREHEVDLTRRMGPHIRPYPEAYVHSIHALVNPSNDDLLEHYLDHNDTRNRALDMLPLFAEHDENAVQAATEDTRINPRPAFHYRLPNCQIDRNGWGLAASWNRWCVVETLANDEEAIASLTADFLLGYRGPLGVDKKRWMARIDQWLNDRGLA